MYQVDCFEVFFQCDLVARRMVSFWLLRLFNLVSNFAMSGLFNFFVFDRYNGRLGVTQVCFRGHDFPRGCFEFYFVISSYW